jgi:hypothetical protein
MEITKADRCYGRVVRFAEKWGSQNLTVGCVMKEFSLTVVQNLNEYQKILDIIK